MVRYSHLSLAENLPFSQWRSIPPAHLHRQKKYRTIEYPPIRLTDILAKVARRCWTQTTFNQSKLPLRCLSLVSVLPLCLILCVFSRLCYGLVLITPVTQCMRWQATRCVPEFQLICKFIYTGIQRRHSREICLGEI